MNAMNVLVVFILEDNKKRYYLEIIFRDFLSLDLYFLIFKRALS